MKSCFSVAIVALCSALTVNSVAAQSDKSLNCNSCRFSVTIVGGVSQFDLSGTGSALIGGVHLDSRFTRWLVGDASLRAFKPTEQFHQSSWYKVPEVQLQLQTPRGAVRPYVGAGGGWFIGAERRGTASGAVGLRYYANAVPFGARAELRVRGIGRSFGGATAEWTVGTDYRF